MVGFHFMPLFPVDTKAFTLLTNCPYLVDVAFSHTSKGKSHNLVSQQRTLQIIVGLELHLSDLQWVCNRVKLITKWYK